ncbi:MAG: endonuclease/exonuclease/phosphatase family protein [Planctomycetaceae bacterium]
MIHPPTLRTALPVAAILAAWLAASAAQGQAPPAPPQANAGPPVAGMSMLPASRPWDAVLVASFNIQVFGETKVSKPQVVEILARIVRRFDVVAIQEVRSKSDSVIPDFVRAVNADGSRYHWLIGPREGRTVSKEQYCFIYDTNRIEVDAGSIGVVPDPSDRLHRPPMHARFRTRVIPESMAFTFWLVDIHTDPDEVPQEIDALADVFTAMRSLRPDEDDVILLGDLNAGPPQFGRLGKLPGAAWAVSGVTTNTHRTKTYDNIVFDRFATAEYLGRWGVLDMQSTFGLPQEAALEVSDHNPVWAAFFPCEAARTAPPGPAAAGIAVAVPTAGGGGTR